MVTFSQRLQRCASKADLTVADLTLWFDRPRPTVNTWVLGRTPTGPAGRCAEEDLARLEYAIHNGFKVPPRLGRTERAAFVRERRDADYPNASHRVSKAHSTG